MIKIYILLLSLVLLSCQSNQLRTNEQKEKENEISAIIGAVVIQDSLDLKIPFVEEIRPFTYFPLQTYEGMKIPSPPDDHHIGIHHVNEFIISRNFEFIKQYQLTKLDTLHIKEQLLHPTQISLEKQGIPNADIFSIEAAKKPGGRKVKKCYIFSMPLFSSDSALVYVQYDFSTIDVTGYGSYSILHKQKGKWIKIGGGPTWMQ